jgi:peptidoglycan/LPS O-acetylase OafA/YrhL
MGSEERRIGGLDGLRALAVLGVFLFHANVAGAQLGWSGVELFYVLSGFLITGILLDARESPGYFRGFYARRALRILPAYFIVLALSVAVAALSGRTDAFGFLPYYLLYLQNYFPQLATQFGAGIPLLSHTWTLAIEEQFYWLWPLVIFVARGRALPAVLAGAFALGPLSRLALFVGAAGNPFATVLPLPAQTDLLAAGAVVALALRSGVGAERIARAAGLAVALGAVLLAALVVDLGLPAFAHPSRWATRPEGILVFSAMSLLFGGLVAGVVVAWGGLRAALCVAPLAHLGRISYGLYLYNPLALFIASSVADPLHPTDAFAYGTNLPAHIAGFALTYLIALLSFRYVETPILRLKRRFAAPTLDATGAPRFPRDLPARSAL